MRNAFPKHFSSTSKTANYFDFDRTESDIIEVPRAQNSQGKDSL
jgi:hypothetical protein